MFNPLNIRVYLEPQSRIFSDATMKICYLPHP